MENIIITGSDGNLGGRLTKQLVDTTDYGVLAVGLKRQAIEQMIAREQIAHPEKVTMLTTEEFLAENLQAMNAVGAVHLAFARGIFPNKDIATSLDFSLTAFRKTASAGVQKEIYMSSQSVYGDAEAFRTTDMAPAPGSVYAMAKYAGEKLFEAADPGLPTCQRAILRLDLVAQSQRLIIGLCKSAIENKCINLKGGKQLFSYIDAADVAPAVTALLLTETPWQRIYNVGADKERYTLVEMAEIIRSVADDFGNSDVKINLTESDIALYAGMDTSAFIRDTGWKPSFSIKQIVAGIYQSLL